MGGVVQSTRTAFSSSVMPSLAKAVGTASIGSLAGLVVNTEASDVSQRALKASLGGQRMPKAALRSRASLRPQWLAAAKSSWLHWFRQSDEHQVSPAPRARPLLAKGRRTRRRQKCNQLSPD